jgi:hypothetical protein
MQTTAQPQVSAELYAQMQSKAFEAVSVVTEMNHRVMQDLIGFSASTAQEGMRACAELQSATVEAARAAQYPFVQPESIETLQQNPFAWYQKSLLGIVEGTQKAFRLLEANAQVVTRSAERLQASADRTAHEIQETLTSSANRLKQIYSRN